MMSHWWKRKNNGMPDAAEALADCLARMEAGEDAETTLARYPHLRDELAPLLELAADVRPVVSGGPPDDVRLRLRYELRGAVRVLGRRKRRPVWRPFVLRLATATLAVLLLMGGGLAAASQSEPGTPLYPVGMAMREARLRLPLAPKKRLRHELDLLEHMAADLNARPRDLHRDVPPLFMLAGRTDDWLVLYRGAPPPLADSLRSRALELVSAEQDLFQDALDHAPPWRRPALEALHSLAQGWDAVLSAPPGQPPPGPGSGKSNLIQRSQKPIFTHIWR